MKSTPEKTRYSDEELSEFKTIIERKLAAARDQLQYCMGQLSELGDNEDAKIRGLDDGTGSMEREQLSILATRQRSLIGHLEKALHRIESKMYGICRVTGKLIQKERLKAVPHATLSIEAKKQRARR